MGASTATLKMLLLGEDRTASKVLKGVGSETDKTASSFSKFAKISAAALVGAAAAAVAFGKSSVDAYKTAAAESGTLARTTGATIQQASQLRFAATETGVSFASLSKGMQTFGKNLGGAAGDAKKSADMVKKLGFSFKDAEGNVKPVADLLPQLADKFKNMADGPQKTALAMKLFGKGGVDMIKTLNKGSEGLAELAKESDKTGNTLKDTSSYKAQLAAQREFHAAVSGLKIQLGQALMPILTAVAVFMTQHVAPAFTQVSGFVSTHQHLIATLVPVVFGLATAMGAITIAMKVWSGVTKVASAVAKVFAAVQWLVNAAMSANPIGLVVLAIVALVAAIVIAYKKSDTFRRIVTDAFHAVWNAAQTAFNWVKQNWPLILAILTGPIGIAVLLIVKNWGKISGAFGAAMDWISNKWSSVMHWFGGLGGKIAGVARGMWNGIGDAFRSAINTVIDLWNGLHFSLPTIHAFGHSVGGGTIGVPQIPHLAQGGVVTRPTVALIGEAGPEAVVPLSRGRGAMGGFGGGGDVHITINGALDPIAVGKQVQQALLKVKRANGGKALGLT